MAIINGTNNGETLNGTPDDDVINGLGGNDTLNGLGGNDILDGGDGDDTLNGGDGDDELRASSGFDSANGGAGTDTLTLNAVSSTVSVFTEVRPTTNATLGGFDGSYLETGIRRIGFNSIERFNISTGSGNDIIITASGNDVVRTGAGDDIVDVGSGIDTADGGTGVDGLSADFSANSGAVSIDLRNAVNSGAFGSFSNFEYFVNVTGSAFNDVLIGSDVARDQRINLGDGDDVGGIGRGGGVINGGLGTDTAIIDFSAATTAVVNEEGPTANTTLGGFNGNFLQSGVSRAGFNSVERFVITTGSGDDNIRTASGDDIIRAGVGNDIVNAGAGNDEVDGGPGDDVLNGGDGIDMLSYASATAGVTVDLRLTTAQNTGGAGTDTISNFERITGSAFNDTLTGTDGANRLLGGAGADTLIGLGGNDDYFVDDPGDVVVEQVGGGTLDTVFTTLASYTLTANVEQLFGESDAGQTLTGNDLNNFISGRAGNDRLNGGVGNDTLVGGAGNDILDGGTGADSMFGGIGDDVYIVDNAGDLVSELSESGPGGGTDEVRTTLASYSLASLPDIENLTGMSATGQSLTGNALANVITGSGDNDTLDGGGGADTLRGGGGNDIYIIDNAGDVVVESAGAGTDEVRTALAAYMLGANVENLTGTSATGQTLTGNALANVIIGAGGNDTIDGGAGADTLRGGAGNDIYFVDNAGDVVTENAGEGTDTVRTALATYTLSANVENLTYTGTAAASLRGNASNNIINGAGAGDVFFLQDGGDDVVTGLAGNDGFYFGAALTGADEVDGGAGTLDQVALQGNYAGLTLGAKNLVGIEQLVLLPGSDARFGDTSGALYSYNITTVNANVAAGQQLIVTFNTLRAGENVTFNGAAETDGSFITYGGLGTDIITGGQNNDGFFFGTGGRFGASDRVDGQGGTDQLGLQGVYTGANAITFGADQLRGIEFIVALSGGDTRFGSGGAGYSYDLTTNNGNVLAGQTLIVSANTLRADETLTFNGSAETDGRFQIFSGAGADVITGGAGADEISGLGGNDRITGGLGADRLTGGDGADTFAYASAAESTGLSFDQLIGFDSRVDRIDLPGTIGAVTDLLQGTLRRASFDADLAAAVNGQLDPSQAVIFTATSGDAEFAGRRFAIIDANGDGAYQAGTDYVIEIVSPAVPIAPGDDFFI
jgi:Ca2+-binding RTX toxin-like protein